MKKIPTLFVRYPRSPLVTEVVNPGCEWVLAGEGVATRKWDGTAVLIQNGVPWKRYEVRAGGIPGKDFVPANDAPDPVTGKWAGWVPVTGGPEDKYHREAFRDLENAIHEMADGTYELVGPKINGGHEGFPRHILIRHGLLTFDPGPVRTFAGIGAWLYENPVEGIVWWHEDGRRAKAKRVDFGLPWPVPARTRVEGEERGDA